MLRYCSVVKKTFKDLVPLYPEEAARTVYTYNIIIFSCSILRGMGWDLIKNAVAGFMLPDLTNSLLSYYCCETVSKPSDERNQQSAPPSPFAAPSKMAAAAAAPVAYPFTLLKPEGGLTLREINEKLMLPPPSRPMHNHAQAAEDSWPTSASELGLGLSGKSVITRTRIHTMGNGTITIMRTKD